MSNLEGAAAPQQAQLTVSGILADLDNGLTRPMIQTKYKLSGKDLTELFKHPKLKGKKTKAAPGFVLVDDTPDDVEETATDVEAVTEDTDIEVVPEPIEAIAPGDAHTTTEESGGAPIVVDDSWEEGNMDSSDSLV